MTGHRTPVKTIDATPRAALLIESMRDLGYSLGTALADIIDNSISAGSSSIQILTDAIGTTGSIAVVDDGCGMTKKELHLAMRPGSRSPLDNRDKDDLGRFGLGLKTASFSQCRKLSVVTRRKGTTSAAVWDLDHVSRVDRWEVQLPQPSSVKWSDQLGDSGTLVVWETLDRIVSNVDESTISVVIADRLDEAGEHIATVFHRWLIAERGFGKKLQISINNRQLKGIDPFNSRHRATISEPPEDIQCGEHVVKLQAFTLPHHGKVSPAEWDRYAGREGYLRNQGFYVYRERRLIIHGTWFNLARQSELTKLSRVRIDMPSGLDAEWKIDVRKASARPPAVVRERLRQIIERIGAKSRRIYRYKGRTLAADGRMPVWNRIQHDGDILYNINYDHPVLEQFTENLPPDQLEEFRKVAGLIVAALPVDAIFADTGDSPKSIKSGIEEDALRHAVVTTAERLTATGTTETDVRRMLEVVEPFKANPENTRLFLDDFFGGKG
jgi:hypothetical protein